MAIGALRSSTLARLNCNFITYGYRGCKAEIFNSTLSSQTTVRDGFSIFIYILPIFIKYMHIYIVCYGVDSMILNDTPC